MTAERSLQTKETKRAREDVRIATNKIETLTAKLSDLRRTEPKPSDNRVFPMVYAGVVLRQDGHNVLTPMRYFCRPAGKPAFLRQKNSRACTTHAGTISKNSGASSSGSIMR